MEVSEHMGPMKVLIAFHIVDFFFFCIFKVLGVVFWFVSISTFSSYKRKIAFCIQMMYKCLAYNVFHNKKKQAKQNKWK